MKRIGDVNDKKIKELGFKKEEKGNVKERYI